MSDRRRDEELVAEATLRSAYPVEPVPDDMTALLRQIDEGDRGGVVEAPEAA